MAAENKPFIVYVDTSYLTHMPAAERADWQRLLEHAKACVANLDLNPRVEIHVSEIALREYRHKMVDELQAKIEQTRNKMKALQEEWQANDIAKKLDYPFPDRDLFPSKEKIDTEADNCVGDLLNYGIKKIKIEEHHKDAVWENYFNWDPPFNSSQISERDNKKVREKRRFHIPDAWILEAAIDAKNLGNKMVCLCDDGNLSTALEANNHQNHKSSKSILDILFPPPPINASPVLNIEAEQSNDLTPLETLLSKAPNKVAKEIYLRLLGFVVPLDTPTHESLVNAVVAKGYERRLTDACAVLLSDKSHPFIKDTGSHYIAGDKAICSEASSRLTLEIIQMLNGGSDGN